MFVDRFSSYRVSHSSSDDNVGLFVRFTASVQTKSSQQLEDEFCRNLHVLQKMSDFPAPPIIKLTFVVIGKMSQHEQDELSWNFLPIFKQT